MELAGESESVSCVVGFKLWVQFVCCLEERRMECPPVALEAVVQGCERAVGVHPLAQVRENLLAGFVVVEGF